MALTFADDCCARRFRAKGLSDFDALWQLDASLVEPGNERRGGWSTVSRFICGAEAFFLKRQLDHDFRDPDNRYQPQPTVLREWRNSTAYAAIGIGVATPVCMGVDRSEGSRGLMVTRALEGYRDLTDVLADRTIDELTRGQLIRTVGSTVRRLHDHGFRHNCLYGQHVLLKQTGSADADWDIRLIDLEKATRPRNRNRATIGDLSQLDRHTESLTNRDRYLLWDSYFQGFTLKDRRRLLMRLARRSAVRSVHQYFRDITAGRRPAPDISEDCA